jgi:hypothetical protein
MAFEQLVAEAAIKKEKKKKAKEDPKAAAAGASDKEHTKTAEEVAADAPNVPKR